MFQVRLKELRENAKYSQYTFADAFGVAQSTIGGWESGTREPNFTTMQRLADFFGVTTDYLLGRTNDPLPPDTKKAAKDEITFDDFDFALHGEVRELSEEEKAELLRSAQRMNELRKLKNKEKAE